MTTPDGDPEPQVRTENLLWNAVLRLSRLSVAYGVGRVSTKALSVLLVPIYIRYLTPADLGIVATATLTAGIVGLVGKLHQDASVLRFYYDYRDAREDLGRFLGGLCRSRIRAEPDEQAQRGFRRGGAAFSQRAKLILELQAAQKEQ